MPCPQLVWQKVILAKICWILDWCHQDFCRGEKRMLLIQELGPGQASLQTLQLGQSASCASAFSLSPNQTRPSTVRSQMLICSDWWLSGGFTLLSYFGLWQGKGLVAHVHAGAGLCLLSPVLNLVNKKASSHGCVSSKILVNVAMINKQTLDNWKLCLKI